MMLIRNRKTSLIMALILLSILFPFIIQNNYFIHIMTISYIWMIAVYGLNLLAGYTGYLSLAHAGFFAIGAYSLGLLTVKAGINFWLALILACIITGIIGFLIGIIALRTREHFFAIYTLCVGYIIYLVIDKWDGLTGGVRGLIGIPAPANLGPLSFQSAESQYFLVLFFLLLSIFIMYRIVYSLTGRTYLAIRNSEDLALTIGISTMKNKLVSFILSTVFAGLAGALYAGFVRFIGPDIAYINITFDLLIYLLIGGIGTLSGPIAGTLLIVWLSQYLQFLQDYRMLVFGPLLAFLIIFYPRGLAGIFHELQQKRRAKKEMAGGNGVRSRAELDVNEKENAAGNKQVREGS